jgi:hypothetical protein
LKFNCSSGFGCPTFSFHLNVLFIEPRFGLLVPVFIQNVFEECLQLSVPIEWLETLVHIASVRGSILSPEGGYT